MLEVKIVHSNLDANMDVFQVFFHDLKHYNSTNFKSVASADLSSPDASTCKAFSSIITRFFIFKEKHPEIAESEFLKLYYKLKLDLIAKYFYEYPDAKATDLVTFQVELNNYLSRYKGAENDQQPIEV